MVAVKTSLLLAVAAVLFVSVSSAGTDQWASLRPSFNQKYELSEVCKSLEYLEQKGQLVKSVYTLIENNGKVYWVLLTPSQVSTVVVLGQRGSTKTTLEGNVLTQVTKWPNDEVYTEVKTFTEKEVTIVKEHLHKVEEGGKEVLKSTPCVMKYTNVGVAENIKP